MSSSALPPVRVLLTRPEEQAQVWAKAITAAGAVPVFYPTIEVVPPPSWRPLDEAMTRLMEYDWVIFTSAAAVRFTLGRGAGEVLPHKQVAAVGDETARALEAAGVPVRVRPKEQQGEGLANALSTLPPGTRVLFPQALGGRVELRDALIAQGCTVDVVAASQTLPIHPLPPLPPFDVATFASPSALRAFVAGCGLADLKDRPTVVLGPTSAATAIALGLKPVVAMAPNAAAIVEAIARAFAAFAPEPSTS